ncbi:MAG TPA: hypothetical protein VGR02_07350 [Thermoanaerobaculia bacterium]|jgi:hypothetical protein|nr:hypothetical protein [Thermoanaerobaculia bacterium]
MVILRQEQFDALAADAQRRFEDELRRFLLSGYPRAVAGIAEGELRTRIASAVARAAASHGLTFQSSIAVFVAATFTAGERFDEYPPIAAILARPSSEERRMKRLQDLPEGVWTAARAFCDERG